MFRLPQNWEVTLQNDSFLFYNTCTPAYNTPAQTSTNNVLRLSCSSPGVPHRLERVELWACRTSCFVTLAIKHRSPCFLLSVLSRKNATTPGSDETWLSLERDTVQRIGFAQRCVTTIASALLFDWRLWRIYTKPGSIRTFHVLLRRFPKSFTCFPDCNLYSVPQLIKGWITLSTG